MPDVEISIEHSQFKEDQQRLIRAAQTAACYAGRKRGLIEISVVTDETIHRVNREHLDHDWPTDVVSFPYDDTDGSVEGELIVSWDTAQRVAEELQIPAIRELELYVIHGTLHLCGFDDLTEIDQLAMRRAETDVQALLE